MMQVGSSRPVKSALATAVAGALCLLLLAAAGAQTPAFTPRDENPEDYPAGAGRDETFYACTPCHGFRIVAQQGQSRRQWDDTFDWMTQRHNMPKIEGKDRERMLDYLAATYPPRTAPRGWQNPFQR
jgi:hypothetical protein